MVGQFGGAPSNLGDDQEVTNDFPDRLLSPDGTVGWYAFNLDGSRIEDDDEPWRPRRKGSLVRLMGEHMVTVPLCDDAVARGLFRPRHEHHGTPDHIVRLSPGRAEHLHFVDGELA